MSVGSADVAKLAEALRRSGADADATTDEVLVKSANYLLTEMEVRVPVKSGALRNSLGVRREGDRFIIGPTAKHAAYVEFDTKPHVIKPKNPDGVLAFRVGGKMVFAKSVNHPGTKAQPFVRPAFDRWVESLGPAVAEANVKRLKGNLK
mgnify:CR=1 FL=1